MSSSRFWPAFVVSIVGTIVLGIGLSRVEIDASIGTMLVSGDPAYEFHDQYKKSFGSDEVLSVAIPFRDSLNVESLSIQQQVVRELESIDGVVQVTALVTQNDVVGDENGLNVAPLVPDDLSGGNAGNPDWRSELKGRVRNHPIWTGWLVSKSLGAIAMQVRLDDSRDAELTRGKTMSVIDESLSRVLGDREYFLAGHPFMKSEITKSISSDLARLLPVSFLVMTILLLVATRSYYVGLISAFSVLLSVLWMVGAMGWLGLGMTALTNTAPTILVALATASFLHLSAAFQSVRASSNRAAAVSAISLVRRPMWIAAVTTAVGYSSLYLSSVPIVREFGLTLAVGMMGTAIIGTVFLPAMLSFAPGVRTRKVFADGYGLSEFLLWVSRVVARSPGWILVGSIAFGVFMAGAAARIEVDSSGPKRFDEDSRFRRSSRFYRSQFSGDVLESVYLTGEEGDFLNPEVLRRVQMFQAAAERLPEIDRTISVVDYIARTYWVFRGESGDPRALPDSASAIAQLLLLYESSGELGEIADYASYDYDMIRIMLSADVQSSSASAQLRLDLEDIARRLVPNFVSPHSVVSTEMLLSQAADVIAVEQVRSAALALVLVLGLVSLSFGSWSAGGIMILPNILPLITNLGVMSLAAIALSDATSIISATAIGIAVDSSVHIVSSVRKAERESRSRRVAVLHAILTTGRPVVVTSLIVVLGFSLLLLSEFGSVAELGALTAMTMIFCLIADLFILPALLLVTKDTSTERDPFVLDYDGRLVVAFDREDEPGALQLIEDGGDRVARFDQELVTGLRRIDPRGRLYKPKNARDERVG